MPRRGEKVTENYKNTGDNKLSQSTLYRKGIKSSEIRGANEEKRVKIEDDYESPQSDGKNELPWGIAVFLFVFIIFIFIVAGYYGLKYVIDEK